LTFHLGFRAGLVTVNVPHCQPPRLQNPKPEELLNALGATVSFLDSRFGLELPEDFFDDGVSAEVVAATLIAAAVEMAPGCGLVKPEKLSEMGRKKIYIMLLDIVVELFLHKLAGIVSERDFEDRCRALRSEVTRLEKIELEKMLQGWNHNGLLPN